MSIPIRECEYYEAYYNKDKFEELVQKTFQMIYSTLSCNCKPKCKTLSKNKLKELENRITIRRKEIMQERKRINEKPKNKFQECPICKGFIDKIDKGYIEVRDPNTIYQCRKNKLHKFWIHPFASKTIHWNPDSSITNWDELLCWRLEDNEWKLCMPDYENITKIIKSLYKEIDIYKKYYKENKQNKNSKYKKAISITSSTLVGYLHKNMEYPLSSGNCFSMITNENEEYRILNFNHENLKELIKRGLEYPINILPISKHHALIKDNRIDKEWYDKEVCKICCPSRILSNAEKLMKEINDDL